MGTRLYWVEAWEQSDESHPDNKALADKMTTSYIDDLLHSIADYSVVPEERKEYDGCWFSNEVYKKADAELPETAGPEGYTYNAAWWCADRKAYTRDQGIKLSITRAAYDKARAVIKLVAQSGREVTRI